MAPGLIPHLGPLALDEPVLVEILLALAVTAILAGVVRRLIRIARRLDQRRALREFVRGLDHFLSGEPDRAAEELEKVLERDPENVEARIALGDARRALGQAAEAHRHHYHVREVFGHELARNDLSLGRDLLALGDPAAAIPELERAIARGARDDAAQRELRDAYLAVDRPEDAVPSARRILDGAGSDAEREEARRTLARALTLAASKALDGGDARAAAERLEEVLRIAPELVPARMELVRARLLAAGPKAGARAFAEALRDMRHLAAEGEILFEPLVGGPSPPPAPGAGPPPRAAPAAAPERPLLEAPEAPADDRLPARRAEEEHAVATTAGDRALALPEDVLAPEDVTALLLRAARAYCDRCGRTARDWTERCPGCHAYGSMRPRNTARLRPIPDPRAVLDEIEENRAYVRRLCRRLASGLDDATAAIARLGRRAVPLLFREAISATDPRPLTGTLGRLGPAILPDLVESWRRTRSLLARRVFGERARRRSADEILVAAVVGMGPPAVPALRGLLERPEPEVRLLALEAVLRLGSLEVVEEARLLFGVRDLVDRLNALDRETVRDLVEAAPRDSHLVRTVFPDRTFRHEEALVEAFVRGADRDKAAGILRARGFSSGVVAALLPHADDAGLREIVFDLVEGFGAAAADHVLTAVVDPSLGPETRAHAAAFLRRFGIPSLEKLLDGAADRPVRIADAVVDLLGTQGDAVVAGLGRAYASGGWLSKIGLGREKIQSRRGLIVRALVRIGSEAAIMALREIRMRETDPALRREAEAALASLEAS